MQNEESLANASRSGRKLLLVDDDAPLRRNLERALERSGFAVSLGRHAEARRSSPPPIRFPTMPSWISTSRTATAWSSSTRSAT